ERLERRLGDRGQRVAVLLVAALADRQRPPLDREPGSRGSGLHDLHAFRDHLEADVVALEDAELQRHVVNPPSTNSVCPVTKSEAALERYSAAPRRSEVSANRPSLMRLFTRSARSGFLAN